MHDHILRQMRDKIRANEYIVPAHAYEEIQDDDLSILDGEHIILTGSIVERQQDLTSRRIQIRHLGPDESRPLGCCCRQN